jgi:multiple sugar transport system ATP-binding protein
MQGGHKIQYDTPHAIYNHPCAVFVAGFTGSPPMNLLKAECTPSGVKIADQTLTLPAHQLARLAGRQQVVVGIRPENLQLQTIATDGIALHVSLSLLEPLGAETLGLFQIGSQELTARLSARFQQPAGSLLTLHTHTDHLHLFDAATGQAL